MSNQFKHKIAIVIVNYNVEHFLEQCLNSVKKAIQNISSEVFVVDNNSIDHSVEMVKEKFPEFKLIDNKENLGFSKANNQAIRLAESEYILLLNPDTVVEEDTFVKVVDFMDQHPDAGGLGVRMVDGKGVFLPESKRGLPTPAVAFYKIFGLSRIFPKSKKFGAYHLGHLDEFKTHEIDVLSGAFMLMRKTALDKVGLLDEAFFMYGEDIDLSYRIQKGGYKNFYFPETQIIHYKGESTKKSSVNYVFVFYKAMVIFAKKHFSEKNASLFSFLIHLAIYFRASLAISSRIIKKICLPIFDIAYIFGGLFALTNYWKTHQIEFPMQTVQIAIPIYTLIWLSSIHLNGGYERPLKMKNLFKGIFFGTLIILVFYGLLPKDWQFSRLFILIGATWIFSYFIISRVFLHFALKKTFSLKEKLHKRFAIVANEEEFLRISNLIKKTNINTQEIYAVASDISSNQVQTIGNINQLDQIVYIHQIDEVIFSAKDNSASSIIQWMSQLTDFQLEFKIAQPETLYLIGSNSIDTAGDLYVFNINSISKPEKIRQKRSFDIIFSMTLLLLFPIILFFYKQKIQLFKNLLNILIGKKTFVGYAFNNTSFIPNLPNIKRGILSPLDEFPAIKDALINDKLNLIYARDYSVRKDFMILIQSWRKLDRSNDILK